MHLSGQVLHLGLVGGDDRHGPAGLDDEGGHGDEGQQDHLHLVPLLATLAHRVEVAAAGAYRHQRRRLRRRRRQVALLAVGVFVVVVLRGTGEEEEEVLVQSL